MNPIALYLHIPFCIKKCRYCDFYSVRYDEAHAETYLSTLAKEIALCKKTYFPDGIPVIATLYIGGGTPTVLTIRQLRSLCALLHSSFTLAPGYEWTVECNPESFTGEKAAVLLGAGVTRLSFGFQTLNNRELSTLGRSHTTEQCRALLSDQLLSRFLSVTVDLMFGLPGQTARSLERSLAAIVDSPYVKHISAYELTVADATPFGRHRSMLPLPTEQEMAAMTQYVWDLLEANGFTQYEVSNFAKAGHACRHNEAYWNHDPYLGLGCAAHSYCPPERAANVRDVGRYCAMTNDNRLPRDFTEVIDAKKIGMEMVFLGLRRADGINEALFQEKCGISFDAFINRKKRAAFVDRGLLSYQKPFWKPSRQGLLMADAMARELI
jgi:oxygen-independent coproporphyrinogen III oxidase